MASKTERLQLVGALEWAKVFPENLDRAEWNKETDGEFKVTMVLDEENQEKLSASNSGKQIKDGRVTFSRPHIGKQEWQGGAPTVVNIKGQPWSLETNGLIGNGSTGMVTVSIYPAPSGRYGTRLESVQVIDHVVYESEGGSSPRFQDLSAMASKSTADTPKGKAKSTKPQDMDDAIPF